MEITRTQCRPHSVILSVAVLLVVGTFTVVLAYDPSQSTGTGVQQGAIDSKSGRNEDSGSAVGAPRQSSKSGMESGQSHGSKRLGSTGSELGANESDAAGRPMGVPKPCLISVTVDAAV